MPGRPSSTRPRWTQHPRPDRGRRSRHLLRRAGQSEAGAVDRALRSAARHSRVDWHRGTLDFIVGEKKRAPAWLQQHGLEWLYRAAQEPRRLVGPYAHDIAVFAPRLVRQAWVGRQPRRGRSGSSAVVIDTAPVRESDHGGAPTFHDLRQLDGDPSAQTRPHRRTRRPRPADQPHLGAACFDRARGPTPRSARRTGRRGPSAAKRGTSRGLGRTTDVRSAARAPGSHRARWPRTPQRNGPTLAAEIRHDVTAAGERELEELGEHPGRRRDHRHGDEQLDPQNLFEAERQVADDPFVEPQQRVLQEVQAVGEAPEDDEWPGAQSRSNPARQRSIAVCAGRQARIKAGRRRSRSRRRWRVASRDRWRRRSRRA